MHRRYWLGVAFSTAFDESQALLDIVALGAPERVVLEARDSQGLITHHVHQDHLSATSHTTHGATRSPTMIAPGLLSVTSVKILCH
jgi:mRNA degradation ribonuclease J1/J2